MKEIDDIQFYYRNKGKLEYIEKPLPTLDKDGNPIHRMRVVDLLSYLNIDYSNIDTITLLKPLYIHITGDKSTHVVDISGIDKITLHTII